MKRTLFQALTVLVVAASLASCADGEGDSRACSSESFVGNCVDSTHYRACVAGRIEFMACGYGHACGIGENGGPVCFAPSSTTGTCPIPDARQCNGFFVQTCTNGLWTNAAAPCEAGCANGACIPAPQPVQCSAQIPCADPSKVCINNTCVAQTPEPECSAQKACADPAKSCVDGRCVTVNTPECSDQKPCADPAKVCINSTCVVQTPEPECGAQKACADPAQSCVEGRCVTVAADECSSQKPCADPSKTCIYGECKALSSCQSNADCTEFNTLCSGARCRFAPDISCTQNSDCGPGFLCDNLKCLSSNACSMTRTCPDKQICHHGRCQNTPHDTCSNDHPCADASQKCIQGRCVTCNCTAPGQTCDLNGNCVSTIRSDAKNISVGDTCQFSPNWSFCDGNVLFSCSSAVGENGYHVSARDCGASICTNSPTEDLNCHEACSVKGDFYGECLQQYYEITNTFVYYAFKTQCTESDDGRLIWTFTEGYETCRAGCTNGSCDPVPVDYGQDCQPGEYADRCVDQWALSCEKDPNTGKGTVWGEDCAHYSDDQKVYACAVSASDKVSGCVLPCTQEGKTTTVCHKYPNYLAVYSESLQCARTADGQLGYFMTSYQECPNGCDDNTGRCN